MGPEEGSEMPTNKVNNILNCGFTTKSHFVRVSNKSVNIDIHLEKLRFSSSARLNNIHA